MFLDLFESSLMVTGLVRTMVVADTMRMVSGSLLVPTFKTVAILSVTDPADHAFVSASDPEGLALLMAES